VQKTNVTASLSKQFSSFKSDGGLEPIVRQIRSIILALFWCLFLGPLLLIPLVIVVSLKNKVKKGVRCGREHKIRKTNKLARKYLSSVQKKQLDKKKRFMWLWNVHYTTISNLN